MRGRGWLLRWRPLARRVAALEVKVAALEAGRPPIVVHRAGRRVVK